MDKDNKEEIITGEDNLVDDYVKKNATRNTLLVILILIAIFALIFGVNLLYQKAYRNPYQYEYNDFQFQKGDDGKWYTKLQYGNKLLTIPLTFGPRDLEDIPITGTVDERFVSSRNIYITFDPTREVLLPTGAIVREKLGYLALAASELSLNLVQGINIVPIAACTKKSPDCVNRPIITCESGNATIFLKKSVNPSVSLEGNCIIVSGTDLDLVKSVDRLLLHWYRIMP